MENENPFIFEHLKQDPYFSFPDSKYWRQMLEKASTLYPHLLPYLHAARCCGIILIPHEKYGFKFEPVKNFSFIEFDYQTYERVKEECLNHHTEEVKALLKQVQKD